MAEWIIYGSRPSGRSKIHKPINSSAPIAGTVRDCGAGGMRTALQLDTVNDMGAFFWRMTDESETGRRREDEVGGGHAILLSSTPQGYA